MKTGFIYINDIKSIKRIVYVIVYFIHSDTGCYNNQGCFRTRKALFHVLKIEHDLTNEFNNISILISLDTLG